MQVIVLAAGQGYQLDGFNKLLIRDPIDGRTVIEKYIETFNGCQITVVVGYRAINVMNKYRDLNYIYNSNWAIHNSSYSLSLAIKEPPCYVIPADIFIDKELITMLDNSGPNIVLTENRENRSLNALNCSVNESGRIIEIYQGKLKNIEDPEAIGIYKISDPSILLAWKQNCIEHSNLYAGQNIPLDNIMPIHAIDLGPHRFDEVNTPLDYIQLLDKYA